MKDTEAKGLQRALGGRYEVLEVLGRGAMGAVFRGRDPGLNREVAIKTIQLGHDKLRLERFKREAELTAALEHPGILHVHSAGVAGGVPYLVTELVPGGQTLADVFPHKSLRQRVALVRDVASALGYAHRKGVVHRDVKPQNVLIDAKGQVRVADFGLAAAEGLEKLTKTGAAVGTPAYMPPEQIRGSRAETSPASDVWGVGIVLFEAIAGKVPFIASSYLPLSRKICEDPHPSLEGIPDVDESLRAVVDRALAKRPQDRYPTAAELAEDLEAWLAGAPTSASTQRLPHPPRSLPLRFVPPALALLLLIGVALWGGRTPPDPGAGASPEASTATSASPSDAPDPSWVRNGERRWRRASRLNDPEQRLTAISEWLERYAEHPLADEARALLAEERRRLPSARLDHGAGAQVRACFHGEAVISWGDDGVVCRWDQGELTKRWRLGTPLYALVVRRDGLAVAAGNTHELIVFSLDPRDGQPPRRAAWTEPGGAGLALALHPDGASVAVGGRGPTASRFAIGPAGVGAKLADYADHVGEVHALAFSPGGTELVTVCGNRADRAGLRPSELRVYDEYGGAQRETRAMMWVGQALTFFPDGQRFVLGDSAGQLEICDLTLRTLLRFEGQEVGALLGEGMDSGAIAHGGGVRGVALVRGGQQLYSVSGALDKVDRNELRSWDTEAGEELLSLRHRPTPYVSLDVSPDGKTLVAGTTQGVVEVWRLE